MSGHALCEQPACNLRPVRVRIDDPHLLPDLRDTLAARIDAIVAETEECELEVSLLGSFGAHFQRAELESRLRAWRLEHPGARVQIRD